MKKCNQIWIAFVCAYTLDRSICLKLPVNVVGRYRNYFINNFHRLIDGIKLQNTTILTPPLEKIVFDTEVIEYLADGLIDNILDGFGLMIKGRNRR